ncbi:MAG: PEGA domain-containing protein [Myxococcota bacterium]|nr:PEGA domain-containing protein [Myxococcota bacterium]
MYRLFLLFWILFLPSIARADVRLAVLEFQGIEVEESLLRVLSDKVRAGTLKASKGRKIKGQDLLIITRENMLEILKDMGKGIEDCKGACEVELAKNIGADYVISGELVQIRGLYVLSIKMHETARGNLLGTEDMETESVKSLISATQNLGVQVFREGIRTESRSLDSDATGFSGGATTDWSVQDDNQRRILLFQSDPQGAAVLVDGQLVCNATPCSKAISVGSHYFSIQKERYFEWGEQREISKEQEIYASLKPKFGYLHVSTNPEGVDIRIDQRQKQTTPINVELDAGMHELQVDDPCYTGPDYRFQLQAGQKEIVTRYPLTERPSGIDVSVSDQDNNDLAATIFLDGEKIGTSPGTFDVPVCAKSIRVEYQGKIQEKALYLREKSVENVSFTLYLQSEAKKPVQPHRDRTPFQSERNGSRSSKASPSIRNTTIKARRSLIANLEQMLRDRSLRGEPRIALLFRLAEQYYLEGQYWVTDEDRVYEAEYTSCLARTQCDSSNVQKDTANSQMWMSKSARAYLLILKENPQHVRNDEVLYRLGTILMNMGKTEEAMRHFGRLLKGYAKSRYRSAATMQLGEHYFSQDKPQKAIFAYKKIPLTAPQYRLARYRLAWCYFNLSQYEEAIETMKEVVAQSADTEGTQSALYRQSLRDIAQFYRDSGRKKDGVEYLRSHNQPDLIRLIEP